MKKTNEKIRIRNQIRLNSIFIFSILFITYGCLGPYYNNNIDFLTLILNIIKLISIDLLIYVIITFINYFTFKYKNA